MRRLIQVGDTVEYCHIATNNPEWAKKKGSIGIVVNVESNGTLHVNWIIDYARKLNMRQNHPGYDSRIDTKGIKLWTGEVVNGRLGEGEK